MSVVQRVGGVVEARDGSVAPTRAAVAAARDAGAVAKVHALEAGAHGPGVPLVGAYNVCSGKRRGRIEGRRRRPEAPHARVIFFGVCRKLSVSAWAQYVVPHQSRRVRGTPRRARSVVAMFPSSVQEEEAHLRAALRASAAQAPPSSARAPTSRGRSARRRQATRSRLDPAHVAAEHRRACHARARVGARGDRLTKAAAQARPTHRARAMRAFPRRPRTRRSDESW